MATSSLNLHYNVLNAKPNLRNTFGYEIPKLFLSTENGYNKTTSLLKVTCKLTSDVLEKHVIQNGRNVISEVENEEEKTSYTCVMKFGGSSVASAERMMEVANLVLSFPDERPIVVLSAMGKTTNKLLLAGEKAVSCGVTNVSCIEELSFIKDLHFRTVDQLGVDRSVVESESFPQFTV
ncbi:hypothetical protein TSUD_287090 [Trifolium subterraneum]|uniref:Aspartate/glutamate/uridylate kinase domain-containing protein n=1 Tax=Trifolium subterraneum TaxID=3900 RepID=A0A2Z6MQR8_TRISU|nr:hypothetical protein TSUD_287090 [Trifolium subterraneum]